MYLLTHATQPKQNHAVLTEGKGIYVHNLVIYILGQYIT